MLIIDFETRSPTPIRFGAHKYADKAEIICMAYCFGNGPVDIWRALEGEKFPPIVSQYIRGGGNIAAHNAEFEAVIFNACLPGQAPEMHQWVCSATLAAACGLPRNLGNLGRCLKLKQQKQPEGKMLIQECCIPHYNEDLVLLGKMYEYCMQDVEATRDALRALREFTDNELDDFHVNLIINQRGIPVDMFLAGLAKEYADDETEDLRQQIEQVTRGELTKKGGAKLTDWVYHNLPTDLVPLMERPTKTGETLITLDKAVRQDLLTAEAELPHVVYTVIECADQAGRSSVAKYKAMINRGQEDDRVRGAYLMNGAAQTGRYSSHGLQMHNLPRISHPNPEAVIDIMAHHDPLPKCMETLSHMLRPAVRAEVGKRLVWGDWSAIEGRVLPWLAGSALADAKLDLYRQGQDVYVHTASAMLGCPIKAVSDEDRQLGKVAELALGFAGGAGALHAMGRIYDITFNDTAAEAAKQQWRANNRWAVSFWQDIQVASNSAFNSPGEMFHAGRLRYIYTPDVLLGALWCLLPSGRALCYPGVKRTQELAPWGEEVHQLSAIKGNLLPKATEKDWPRAKLWKGLLAENATQAVAADIMRTALRDAVLDYDWPVIGHTHDEIVMEVDITNVNTATTGLKWLMERTPEWALGLPLAAKMGSGERYGK